jgi:hypothetical protein
MIETEDTIHLINTIISTISLISVIYLPSFIMCKYASDFLYNKLYKKELTIVRGVPGSGKKTYVISKELKSKNEFLLLNSREYFFDKNGKFNFNGKEINKADNYIFSKLLDGINKEIPYIYIVGFYEQKWMYQNIIKLGLFNNYKVNIIEIDCPDIEHLEFFNKRTLYQTPLSKSLTCYNNWEKDDSAIIQQPYIPYLLGDSLPSGNRTTFDKLDKDLDNYFEKSNGNNIDQYDTESIDSNSFENDETVSNEVLNTDSNTKFR